MAKNIKQPNSFPISKAEVEALFPFTSDLLDDYNGKVPDWQDKLTVLYTGNIGFPVDGSGTVAQVGDAVDSQEIISYYKKKLQAYLDELR